SYITGNTLEDFPDFQIPRECDYGVFPVMKRECFEKVGVLDTQYKHYYADPDLGYRIQEQGYKNIYIPTSVIMHYWLSNHTGSSRKATVDEPRFYKKWGLTKNGVEMLEMFKSYWAGKDQGFEMQTALKTEDKA
ncbi:MAG: hypothetical protein HZA14_02445, partial [Nitrospirae bacterium]|nr:hypothetical protein [Nitrospirota bacterium]